MGMRVQMLVLYDPCAWPLSAACAAVLAKGGKASVVVCCVPWQMWALRLDCLLNSVDALAVMQI